MHMAISEREIGAWAQWLRAAGRSESTIELRTYHVRRIMREVRTDPWSLTTQELVDYLAGQGWAAETRRAYRASLRSFYGWARATDRRSDSPAVLLPPVRVPRKVPRPTPEAYVQEALKVADERQRLMIQLAAICGLRRSEIAKARREDVVEDLIGHQLRVLGKGGNERLVPLPKSMARELLAMPQGWLFPSPVGGHLTPHYVGKLISRCLPEGWTTHTLRHRCATVAYAAGGRDLRAVQELLGHRRPETTAIYTEVPVDAIRNAIAATAL